MIRFNNIFRSIFYSIKNVLLYRSERVLIGKDPHSFLRKGIGAAMVQQDATKQMHLLITNYMLMGLGLIVTNRPGNHLSGIYLTKRQKEVVSKVRSVGGYNVDLL